MIFIGGIAQGRKQFDFIQTMICSKCGRYSSVSVFMTYTYFSFFFIPLFKWNRQYFAVSNCCSTVFSIPNALGEAIAGGESVSSVWMEHNSIVRNAAICSQKIFCTVQNAAERKSIPESISSQNLTRSSKQTYPKRNGSSLMCLFAFLMIMILPLTNV